LLFFEGRIKNGFAVFYLHKMILKVLWFKSKNKNKIRKMGGGKRQIINMQSCGTFQEFFFHHLKI